MCCLLRAGNQKLGWHQQRRRRAQQDERTRTTAASPIGCRRTQRVGHNKGFSIQFLGRTRAIHHSSFIHHSSLIIYHSFIHGPNHCVGCFGMIIITNHYYRDNVVLSLVGRRCCCCCGLHSLTLLFEIAEGLL